MVKVPLHCHYRSLGSNVIKLWVQLSDFVALQLVVDVLLKHSFDHQRPGSKDHVKANDVPLIVNQGPIIPTVYRIQEVG